MARLYRVIIPVLDIEAAETFYSAIFGEPGKRVSPERHYFDCEGTIFACFAPMLFKEWDEFKPNPDHVYIAVDDLDDYFSRCKSAGAKVLAETQAYPWGETAFYVEDPSGNKLCFVDRSTMFTG